MKSRLFMSVGIATLLAAGVGATGIRPAGATPVCSDYPSLNDQNYTVGFDQTLKVPAPGLLATDTGTGLLVEVSWGDSNANPDPSDDYSLYGNADIRYGDPTGVRNRQGGFTYTPDPDPDDPFSGIDEFDYWAIDACGNDDLATAYITVVPTVVDSSYSTPLNTELDVPVESGFLAHDLGVDPYSMFYDFTSAQGGSIDDDAANDGSFTYTPPPDFSGTDSFGYQVDDLNGDNTYFGTVYIEVGGPTAPTSVVATGGNHQASVSFSGANDNGSPITSYTVTASPGGQTVTGSASPLVVPGLTDGTSYRFSVHGSSSAGTGAESALSNAVVPDDGLPPTVTMSAPSGAVWLSTTVAASWHATDVSGIARYDVRRAVGAWDGMPGAWTAWNAGLTTSTTYGGTYGGTYCFAARAADKAGHLSAYTAARCTTVPLKSSSLAYTSSFKRVTTSAAYAGFEYASSTHGAVMTRTGVIAKQISLVVAKCSYCGTVQVRLNGVTIANVSTKAASTVHKQVIQIANWSTPHSGILTATVTSATGKVVAIEGLAVGNG